MSENDLEGNETDCEYNLVAKIINTSFKFCSKIISEFISLNLQQYLR